MSWQHQLAPSRAEDGIALITVLWMLVLLSIVAAALSMEARSSTGVARNVLEGAIARAAADAGIQRAILDLQTDLDTAKFRTDGTGYDWQFGGSTVRISIRDEATKIDLNLAAEPVLTRLFASTGVDTDKAELLAAAVVDYRDPDSRSRLNGAETTDYREAGLAWSPKNAPFQTVGELHQVFGMTPEIYKRVAPLLTVYSAGNPGDIYGPQNKVYSLRAQSRGPNGGAFAREAVVRFMGANKPLILLWRQGLPAD